MEKILDTSRVTQSHQITLKKEVREKLKVNEGDKVVFLEINGEIVIRSANK